MGSDLSCFDWSNLAAEYLDGSLAPGLKRRADEHLTECRDCSERQQHYRLILESLRSLPRTTTPSDLQHELEMQAPRLALTSASPLLKVWKASMESMLKSPRTASIAASILAGLAILGALPKIRSFYEQRIQQRLDSSNFAELPLTGQPSDSADESVDEFISEEVEDDDDSAGDLVEASLQNGTTKKAGAPQVWRFILRTDSPQEMRAKIHRTLVDAQALPTSRFLNGFAAPGGIQFDAFVPLENIDRLKNELSTFVDQKAASAGTNANEDSQGPYPTSPFTWYKNKSKRPLPAGAARVIVWISLI
jgi:hypothetical protein